VSDDLKQLKTELAELAASMKPMHLLMAKALAEGKNQEQSYVDAGGDGKDARKCACGLIKTNPDILKYVDLAKQIASKAIVDELEITEQRIMKELGHLGFFNIKRLYNEDGRLLEPHELDDDIAAAVTKVKETVLRSDKESGDVVIKREYEMADKKGALQLLGNSRSIQMFREHKVIDSSLDALIDELTDK
jgi:phage terminase small subunit